MLQQTNVRRMRFKISIRMVVTVIIIMILGIFSVACSGKATAKKESEIVADVKSQDKMILDYDLNVTSSSITKRQTNTDQKTDYVWLELEASNSDFSYTAEYYLEYVLYNDGWLLENYDQIDGTYIAQNPGAVTEKDASEIIESKGFDQWLLVDRKESSNHVVFTYTASTSQYYEQTEYDVVINFKFSPWNQWKDFDYTEKETNVKWDIIGEWTYRDDVRDFYVRVTDYDFENGTIDIEYNLVNVEVNDGFGFSRTQTISTNGITTITFGYHDKHGRFINDPNYWINMWVYAGELRSLTQSGIGCGISVDGYWLNKQ